MKTIVSLGRFDDAKGFDVLLAAVAKLKPQNIRLFLAGDGKERKRIQELVAEYQLQDRVRLVGWRHEVRDFLLQGDLFVLPSRYEPFGIVLLEAMACGIPIVTTNCDGPREILDAASAWFCAADNADSLAEAMAQALADPVGRQARAERALQLYKDSYTLDKAVLKFEALYRQLAVSSARRENGVQ